MLERIQTLEPHEVQKIAAGEVIERPVGVIKECIENSLDAGATEIKIFIEDAGKRLIKIVDNGCGIHADDLHLALSPFATSKIKQLEDLEQINSFGFRGEALASIAAISKVTLQSKTAQASEGSRIIIHAQTLIDQSTTSCAQGTSIAIEDLFFNTPVRKKFLRAPETEWNAIQQIVYAFCLSNLSVHFELFKEGKNQLHAPAVTSLQDRICQLWGLHLAEQMTSVAYEQTKENINIAGIISTPSVQRYNRQQIFCFVNGRLVKNPNLTKALLKGYGPALQQGRFPTGVLLIRLNGSSVDVNIHPRKEEVRFTKPGIVENAITHGVRSALEEQTKQALQKTDHPKAKTFVDTFFDTFKNEEFNRTEQKINAPYKAIVNEEAKKPLTHLFKHDSMLTGKDFQKIESPIVEKTIPESPVPKEVLEINKPHVNQKTEEQQVSTFQNSTVLTPEEVIIPRIIGQYDKTYLLLESEEGLLLIDQHAAHERILYERWQKNFEKKEGSQLLFPLTISLTSHETRLVMELQDFFAHQGFEIDALGPQTITVYSSPPQINGVDITECIKLIASKKSEHDDLSSEELRKLLNEHMHSHLACKAAVKAGDSLTPEAQEQLIKDLYKTPNRHMCIHGRPTIWKLSKSDVAKQFKRPG